MILGWECGGHELTWLRAAATLQVAIRATIGDTICVAVAVGRDAVGGVIASKATGLSQRDVVGSCNALIAPRHLERRCCDKAKVIVLWKEKVDRGKLACLTPVVRRFGSFESLFFLVISPRDHIACSVISVPNWDSILWLKFGVQEQLQST